MNKLNFIFFGIVFLYLPVFWCQNWQSISRIGNYEVEPYQQFSINPHKNQLWFVNENKVSVIESNGDISIFDQTHLGDLMNGLDLKFTFTPNHIYYARDYVGLYTFDEFVSQEAYLFERYYGVLRSDNEDVYMIGTDDNWNISKFNQDNGFFNLYLTATDFAIKNGQLYVKNGTQSLIQYTNPWPNVQFEYLQTDINYLGGTINELKFSRHSDTLYVAGKKGISFAYNYDFLDTITPNNTTNMLSPNVLEIEFDHEDKLWAVFGDASYVPIGLAKLEGSTWVNRYDATNSPIDFNNYLGMEIDTLGNVWVVDNQHLHTLLSENSPAWLSTVELKPTTTFSIHPNPTKDYIELSIENPTGNYQLLDAQGRIVKTEKIQATNQLIDLTKLQSGVYFVAIDGNVKRFVKQ